MPVSQLSVCLNSPQSSCQDTFICHVYFCSPQTHSSACVFYHLLLICCFLFPTLLGPPSLHSVLLSTSPRVVVYSSPPSFKCWWAGEQYPGGHGDRQPPPCGLFLLLSLVLLLQSINHTYIGLIPLFGSGFNHGRNIGDSSTCIKAGYLGKSVTNSIEDVNSCS